jgi:hypothetical protein
VCSNGLIVGVTRFDIRRRHAGDLTLDGVADVMNSGIQESEKEKENFKAWFQRRINPKNLGPWIDTDLWEAWGFKAAARVYHIAQTGHDVEIIGPYKDQRPTTIRIHQTERVPGTPKGIKNLYDLSQILAWLAGERRDVQEQLEWREEISPILEPLTLAG